MATRFHGRGSQAPAHLVESVTLGGFGEWWAAIAVLALAAIGVISLSGSAVPASAPAAVAAPSSGTIELGLIPEVLASISSAEQSIAAVNDAFTSLCNEPVLIALELAPDCETGVITLSDKLFDGFRSTVLLPEAKKDVAAAIRVYFARLRNLPVLWESLEAIEIRGHSDPRAVRSPYKTNLVGSQQRPLGVLFFLVGPAGLSKADRADLERLAVVSGVSHSRPPESCPDATRECFADWRRVEIRPVLSESLRRGDWSRTLESVRVATQRIQPELEAQAR